MFAAATSGKPGEAYFLTDGAPLSYREYFGGLLATVGRDASGARSIPLPVARLLARTSELFWTATRRPGEPPLTRTAVELIGNQVTVSDSKARRELGYQPVMSREQGLAELHAAHGRRDN